MTLYTISTQVDVRGNVGPCQFQSDDRRWGTLSTVGPGKTRLVHIKPTQFHRTNAVDDEVRFISVMGRAVPCSPKRGSLIRPNGILVILESPHKDEYNRNPFTPIGPLQKDGKFERRLPSVLNAVRTRFRVPIPNGDIILCNPIQYQASLARLFPRTTPIGKMPRDSMWNALYGIAAIEADFINRLGTYRPRLILEACTGKQGMGVVPDSPKEAVQRTLLNQRGLRIINCPIIAVGHPSYWNPRTHEHMYLV